tara:strand:- start:9226 stop:9663 length:438 start_codon:yes stop_codon:yes gene_type:complete
MKFSVLERIVLSQLLPEKGNYANMKLLRKAKENLSFTEEENKLLMFRLVGNNQVWNGTIAIDKATGKPVDVAPEDLKKDPDIVRKMVEEDPDAFEYKPSVEDKDIVIGDVVLKMIVDALKGLDKQEALMHDHVPLYDRLVKRKSP